MSLINNIINDEKDETFIFLFLILEMGHFFKFLDKFKKIFYSKIN